jgi:3'(2'), 5'-bisphosphate nucleotidase
MTVVFDQDQLQSLCGIAQAAGQEIMSVYQQEGGEVWQKDDATPLTLADLRADRVIRHGLETAFPGVFILSEESRSSGAPKDDALFLVDPLDGTKEFLKRNGEFTVNIALVCQGMPIAGVVYAPALGELFFAAHGTGAWMRTDAGPPQLLQVAPWTPRGPLRVIGSRSHGGDKLATWLSTLSCKHSFVAAGSSLKFCRIAQGLADIYPRFGPTSQWDTAAAQCILATAGGTVRDMTGEPLRYGLQYPLLNPEFVAVGDQSIEGAINRMY